MLGKILAILSIAYIVAWLYYLITWFIPLLSTPFGDWGNWAQLSLWSIINPVLFFVGGGILVLVCIIVLVALASDS